MTSEVQRNDQPQRRVDPGAFRGEQGDLAQQLVALHPEQVAHPHRDAGAGEHPVDLALQVRAQPDQLGPVPHPVAQLPRHGRGDPGLGQPAHRPADPPDPRQRADRS